MAEVNSMSDKAEELLVKVESLKNILVASATGGGTSDSDYFQLRHELIKQPLIKDKLPRLVHTCRTLGEFWPFIKDKAGTYAGRRQYLGEQFDSVLAFLEQQALTPGDEPVTAVLANVDAPHVAAAWQKALERRACDPEGAITAARSLLETVCKHILEEQGLQYGDADDLPKLYKATAAALNLSPSQHTEQVFRQILGGCQAVVEGLGALRNRHSDAHGKGKQGVRPASRHAELAVNLAGTMAMFLIATWDARQK
jgi:hypothetical protein